MKPNTPVMVLGTDGAARVVHKIRNYGVVLLDRKIGTYWTYREEQLRKLDTNELAAFLRRERLLR